MIYHIIVSYLSHKCFFFLFCFSFELLFRSFSSVSFCPCSLNICSNLNTFSEVCFFSLSLPLYTYTFKFPPKVLSIKRSYTRLCILVGALLARQPLTLRMLKQIHFGVIVCEKNLLETSDIKGCLTDKAPTNIDNMYMDTVFKVFPYRLPQVTHCSPYRLPQGSQT